MIGSIISFCGINSVLKTHYKKGNLPSVKKDIYGDKITDPSIEHIIPKSKGGPSKLYNYAIANAKTNSLRGSRDIMEFTTVDNVKQYLRQFVNVRLKDFNGLNYVKDIIQTFRDMGVELGKVCRGVK